MHRICLSAFIMVMVIQPGFSQEPTSIPKDVVAHMKSMVGAWTFEGVEGERKFSGEEKVRLTNNKTALLQQGFFNGEDGKKEHYVILSGWDGDKKTVLVRGFTSSGVTFAGEWKKLSMGKWEGSANGDYASFEVKKDTMRYVEQNGEKQTWVSEFKRMR
ncbi:MAG: hypothetical protein AAF483_02370 [Planctomycetota bacterium]